MSEARWNLHAGLVKLASLDEPVLAALVEHVLASDQRASSESLLSRVNKKRRPGWHLPLGWDSAAGEARQVGEPDALAAIPA